MPFGTRCRVADGEGTACREGAADAEVVGGDWVSSARRADDHATQPVAHVLQARRQRQHRHDLAAGTATVAYGVLSFDNMCLQCVIMCLEFSSFVRASVSKPRHHQTRRWLKHWW